MSTTATAARPTTAEADALARRYRDRRDLAARDELVLMYAPMVRHIVFRKVRELPSHCEAEDYVTCGMIALLGAVERYEPSKGATFEQFAWTRVHGAVMDQLRRDDWAPRSVRRFSRELDAATDKLGRSGRTPTDAELAGLLGVSVDELRTKRHEIHGADVVSLNEPTRTGDSGASVERLQAVADVTGRCNPEHLAMASAAKARFRRAFATLPQREREIAVKLYVADMTLREISEELGVSESRVSQIHSELRRKLRSQLEDHAPLFEAVG